MRGLFLDKEDTANPFLFPVALTIFLIALSAASVETFRRLADSREQLEFAHAQESVVTALKDRLELHTMVLRGLQSYLLSLDSIPSYEQFHTFLHHLHPSQSNEELPYGGVQGVGLALRFKGRDNEWVKRWVQEQNNVEITHHSTSGEERQTIVYLSPMDQRNRTALGFDMFSEGVRREAMERARDTGEPALSGKVTLAQEIVFPRQYGFLLYLPVYEGKGVPSTVEERRANLVGFAYSPFRAGDFFSELRSDVKSDLELAIFDGPPSPNNLLHSSLHTGNSTTRLTATREIAFGGRRWTLVLESREVAGGLFSLVSWVQLISVAAGIGLSAAGFFRTRSLVQIAEEKRRRAAVVDASIDAVIVTSAEDRILEFNRAAEILFRIPASEASGYRMGDLLISQTCRQKYNACRETYLTAEPHNLAGQRIEVTAKRWDGVEFPAELSVLPVIVGEGTVFTIYVRDDTEAKEIEHQRVKVIEQEREARLKSEVASRMKDEFLATVSHELRTPLNAILGWASIIKDQPTPEVMHQGVDVILRSARDQVQIVNDLLRINKLVMEGHLDPMQRLELKNVVDRAIAAHRSALDEKNRSFTYNATLEECEVEGNEEWLFHAFAHVIENAIKFSQEKKQSTLRVTIDRLRRSVQVTVEDEGKGIEEAFLSRAIEVFTQEDATTTRHHGGLGIGLAIVQRTVELHGGKLTVESEGRDKGTKVTIVLPTVRERESYSTQDLFGKNVVVISESNEQREKIEQVLEEAGAHVEKVASFNEYTESYKEVEKDLVIVDLTGTEVPLNEWRELIQSEDVATLGLIEDISGDYSRTVLRAGFHSTLRKPIDTYELLATAEALTSPI